MLRGKKFESSAQLVGFVLAICFAPQRLAKSRRIFHCSHSDSAPSAAGAKTDDDDCPSKFSRDSESEDAQKSTKPSRIKGQSAASQPRGHNRTREQVHNQYYFDRVGTK